MKRRQFLHVTMESLVAGAALPLLFDHRSALADGKAAGSSAAGAATGPHGAASAAGSVGAGSSAGVTPLLAVAHGPDPAAITRAAIEALGGMTRFVTRGQKVLVKPNIGWDRRPEQAATTNPEVVAEIIRLCLQAGAASVLVMDNTCNDPRRCYLHSGIADAARAAGAQVDFFDEDRVRKMDTRGERIKQWEVHPAVTEADVRINVPIAKHHGLSGVTLGMKNWLGSVGGPRNRLHQEIEHSLVDLAAFFASRTRSSPPTTWWRQRRAACCCSGTRPPSSRT